MIGSGTLSNELSPEAEEYLQSDDWEYTDDFIPPICPECESDLGFIGDGQFRCVDYDCKTVYTLVPQRVGESDE